MYMPGTQPRFNKGLNFYVRKIQGSFSLVEEMETLHNIEVLEAQPWQRLREFSDVTHQCAAFLLILTTSWDLQMCMWGKMLPSKDTRGRSENKNPDNKV